MLSPAFLIAKSQGLFPVPTETPLTLAHCWAQSRLLAETSGIGLISLSPGKSVTSGLRKPLLP